MLDYINGLTETQKERLYRRIYYRTTCRDWRTLQVSHPHLYQVMRALA